MRHGIDLPLLSETPNENLINMRNGMFDWRRDELIAHDSEHQSIVQLPIEFDPLATCEEFDAWVAEVIPEDSHQLLWEAIGYALICGNRFHKAFLLFGAGHR